ARRGGLTLSSRQPDLELARSEYPRDRQPKDGRRRLATRSSVRHERRADQARMDHRPAPRPPDPAGTARCGQPPRLRQRRGGRLPPPPPPPPPRGPPRAP